MDPAMFRIQVNQSECKIPCLTLHITYITNTLGTNNYNTCIQKSKLNLIINLRTIAIHTKCCLSRVQDPKSFLLFELDFAISTRCKPFNRAKIIIKIRTER
jgi:hypothetical protein